MSIIGQPRDLDDPNRFAWLRGCTDMCSRTEALQAFYGGPVWEAHRAAASATMIDSDNVLLLRSARSASRFPNNSGDRRPADATRTSEGLFVATVYYLDEPEDAEFLGTSNGH
jgi:hypothetical protein